MGLNNYLVRMIIYGEPYDGKLSCTVREKGFITLTQKGMIHLVHSPQPANLTYLWNFGVRRTRALVNGDCPISIAYLTYC